MEVLAVLGAVLLLPLLAKGKGRAKFCLPPPPPVESPAWFDVADQLLGIAGASAQGLAPLVPLPGVGLAVELGQELAAGGLSAWRELDLREREAERQRVIDTCYGHPPGTVIRRFAGRRAFDSRGITLLDFMREVGQDEAAAFLPETALLRELEISIPLESGVRYFRMGEGCCASEVFENEIGPEERTSAGLPVIYREADVEAFWRRILLKKKAREKAQDRADEVSATRAQREERVDEDAALAGIPVVQFASRGMTATRTSMFHSKHGFLRLHRRETTGSEEWVRDPTVDAVRALEGFPILEVIPTGAAEDGARLFHFQHGQLVRLDGVQRVTGVLRAWAREDAPRAVGTVFLPREPIFGGRKF